MTKPLALKWAWHYHSLSVDSYESEEDAIRAAGWASDNGDEALECIEVWDDAGHRVIGSGEALSRADAMSAAEREARPPRPPSVAHVHLVSPDGASVSYADYTDIEVAEADAAMLSERIGMKRVHLKRL